MSDGENHLVTTEHLNMIWRALHTGGTTEVYAFKINKADSNPATAVTPFVSEWGCDNFNYAPAAMNYSTGKFDYGSWKGTEFFFPKPCLLGYDGSVIAYLDPNNYAKDVEGNTVNITSPNGNVMVEFPTVYINRWEKGNYVYVVISNKKLSENFHAYAHHDKYGNVLEHIYMAAYDGSFDGTRLRSISGKAANSATTTTSDKICTYTTREQEINYAKANNNSGEGGEGWYTWHFADLDLIRMLLILLSMSLDSQTAFGRGRDTGYSSSSATGMVTTGSMNTKGLFWGENQGAAGVKVFGIENFWANVWKAVAGWILKSGVQKVKMTYGTEDGSSGEGFNLDGTGYIVVAGANPTGTSGNGASGFKMTAVGMVICAADGSTTTYLCDGFWFDNADTRYAVCGGHSSAGAACGAFCSSLSAAASRAAWNVGAALSYKPLAQRG